MSDVAFELLGSAIKSLIDGLAPSHVHPATIELYWQGSHAEEVYFISRGLLKLVRMEREGRELIIDLLHRGWLSGTVAVIIKHQHPVTAALIAE